MRWGHWTLACAVCAVALAGCAKHTELTVEGVGTGPAAAELRTLLKSLGLASRGHMTGAGSGVKIKFSERLAPSTRAAVDKALARLKSVKIIDPPMFRLSITDERPAVLEALDIEPGQKREYPIALSRGKGKVQLRKSPLDPGSILCTWVFPLDRPVPDLYVHVTVPKDMPDGPQKKLLETLSRLPVAAKHEIVATAPGLDTLVDRLRVSGDQATFVFDKTTDTGLPVYDFDVDECETKVDKRAPYPFIASVQYPHLARALGAHHFEDVR